MRHKFPTQQEIEWHATTASVMAWGDAKRHTKLLPKDKDVAIHVGDGVFLTRCAECGEVFLDAGSSARPAALVNHMFREHNVYVGYRRPVFPIEAVKR